MLWGDSIRKGVDLEKQNCLFDVQYCVIGEINFSLFSSLKQQLLLQNIIAKYFLEKFLYTIQTLSGRSGTPQRESSGVKLSVRTEHDNSRHQCRQQSGPPRLSQIRFRTPALGPQRVDVANEGHATVPGQFQKFLRYHGHS